MGNPAAAPTGGMPFIPVPGAAIGGIPEAAPKGGIPFMPAAAAGGMPMLPGKAAGPMAPGLLITTEGQFCLFNNRLAKVLESVPIISVLRGPCVIPVGITVLLGTGLLVIGVVGMLVMGTGAVVPNNGSVGGPTLDTGKVDPGTLDTGKVGVEGTVATVSGGVGPTVSGGKVDTVSGGMVFKTTVGGVAVSNDSWTVVLNHRPPKMAKNNNTMGKRRYRVFIHFLGNMAFFMVTFFLCYVDILCGYFGGVVGGR